MYDNAIPVLNWAAGVLDWKHMNQLLIVQMFGNQCYSVILDCTCDFPPILLYCVYSNFGPFQSMYTNLLRGVEQLSSE